MRPNLTTKENISSYISGIMKHPILSNDEEYELAIKWKEKKDPKALEHLITSHLRLVAKIASGYSGYGLSLEDLIAEGHLGIMQAAMHFDPSRGFRFSTYASWWIKSKIQDFIFNTWSIVKVSSSKTHKKLFFQLRKLKNALGITDLTDENIEIISKKMEVSKDDVLLHNNRFTSKDLSANLTLNDDNKTSIQDLLKSQTVSVETQILQKQEYQYRKKILHEALEILKEKERTIIIEHRLKVPPSTLKEIANKLNLSVERIRQIDVDAFLKIQKYVKSVQWNAAVYKNNASINACFCNVLLTTITFIL